VIRRALGAAILLLGLSGPVAAADDKVPQLPNLSKNDWIAYVIAGGLIGLGNLWNRKGTKTVEHKTDAQTMLLEDLRNDIADLRQARKDDDNLTTIELAAHGQQLQELAEGQAAQGRQLADHGRQLVDLHDGLAKALAAGQNLGGALGREAGAGGKNGGEST
jgi:hypothetical protein